MRKLLNRFAVWLYKKTKQEQMNPDQFFRGMKVFVNNFIPEDTIMFGQKNYKDMADFMVDQEITRKS